MENQPQQQRLRLDPELVAKNATDVKCSCGHQIFEEGLILKELSAIVSPTALPILIPIEVIVCKKCGELLQKTKK